jgi:hypothetical protein
MLAGGGLGNAVLFSIGQGASRDRARRSIDFAGYKKVDRSLQGRRDRARGRRRRLVRRDEAPGFAPRAARRIATFVGNIVEAMRAYAQRQARRARRSALDDVQTASSPSAPTRMMRAVRDARHGVLTAASSSRTTAPSARINSPMQCMMKEICAQCLQQHKDPVTGEETVRVLLLQSGPEAGQRRFQQPAARLSQNGVQEKLTKLSIDRCLTQSGHRTAAV